MAAVPADAPMPVVIPLVGLPGAGKTTLADALARAFGLRIVSRDVIRDAHGSFTTSMAETVKQANADFHVHLRNAVSLLGSSIEELESVLSNLSETPKRVA